AVAALRSVVRSPAARNVAAAAVASSGKSFRSSPFRLPSRTNGLARRVFRSPAELSACLESMRPYHTATASALFTSLLTASRSGFCWLPEG
ncbi:hypothetical protein M569_03266, partial [Genlisea aurea]